MKAAVAAAAHDRLPMVLLAIFVVAWALLAIAPLDRTDWLLENLLVALALPCVIYNFKRSPLSRLSYVCLFVFALLHAVGAHYTYAKVPAGFVVQDWLGLSRNHFDRLVHFAFGLLVSIPALEAQSRVAVLKSWWSYMLPVTVMGCLSALYEIIEWIIAAIVDPAAGAAYLGTQGDEWDAQKDMACAVVGAVIAMTYAYFADRRGRPMHKNRFARGAVPPS